MTAGAIGFLMVSLKILDIMEIMFPILGVRAGYKLGYVPPTTVSISKSSSEAHAL